MGSNYPIASVSAKLDGKEKGRVNYSPAMRKKVNIADTSINTNIKCSGLSVGQHTLSITATDISGKSITETATIVVNGDVKAPSIKITNTEEGKTVKITQNESGGTLYYEIGSDGKKHTANSSVTVKLSKAGDFSIKTYTKKNSKSSAVISKSIRVSKLKSPEINAEQTGKNGKVTIKTPDSGASVRYKVNDGTYQKYSGKAFSIKDGDTVSAYAYRSGYIKSDASSFTAEFGEPSAPEVKLSNEDGKIAAGKTATVIWKKDKRAESYTARLYRSEDNSLIEEKKTKECTESFTIAEAGEYYIQVIASNELGDSEAGEKVKVTAVAPLTVKFIEGEAGTETEKIIAELKVEYGSGIEKITAPSKRGYTFEEMCIRDSSWTGSIRA